MGHLYDYQVRFQFITGCSGRFGAVCWQQAAAHSDHGTRPNTPAVQRESGPNERWRDFFADKQHALLTRLDRSGAESSAMPGSSLSVAQREACIAVLSRIADAVSAAD
jgi:hypothetical protein